MTFFTALVNMYSMKEILERHHLHSKNLEKLDQPSLELQVHHNTSRFLHSTRKTSKKKGFDVDGHPLISWLFCNLSHIRVFFLSFLFYHFLTRTIHK